jgi:hypothetical protein
LLALIILGALSLLVRWRPNITLLLLWTAAQFAIYLTTFPAAGHGGRYQPLNLLLILPLLAVGLDRVFRSLRMPPSFAIGAVFLTIFVAGELSLQTWRQVTYVGIEHINNTEGQVALWLRLHVPDSNHFAAFDIGRVSFEWGGQVIDLGGLVDPSYYHYLTAGRVPEYLQTRKVEYLMLPGTGIQDMGFDASSLPHPVAEYCSPYGIWLLGFRYTIHATRCQDVYRLSSR